MGARFVTMAGGKLSAEDISDLLDRIARGLEPIFGERYRGLVLFGSYARGEADEGSDVDVLLLLDGDVARWREYLKAEPIIWPLSLESGYVISLFPVNVEDYRKPRKPFLMNARKEGVPVPRARSRISSTKPPGL